MWLERLRLATAHAQGGFLHVLRNCRLLVLPSQEYVLVGRWQHSYEIGTTALLASVTKKAFFGLKAFRSRFCSVPYQRTQYAVVRALAELLLIPGGTHRPSMTSTLGAYRRIARLKSPVGAGSQFDS